MISVSGWLFILFFVRASQMIFDRNVEEPSTNPESALSFPLARSWLSTLPCQVTFPGSSPSHIFCLPQGYTRGLKALFVDSYGPTVNMFSTLVLSECEAIGAVAGDESLAHTFDNSSEKT